MNLSKFAFISLLFFLITFVRCAPAVKVTGTWSDKSKLAEKKYTKVFVLAITGNGEIRSALENDMALAASKAGFNAVKSGEAFPAPATGNAVVKKEDLVSKAIELGCDGIVTFAVLDQKETSRCIPGNLSYSPIGYGFYDAFSGYYGYWSPVVYSGSYYADDKYYYLESNFYDAVSQKMLWSVQTEVVNPKSIQKFSKEYTNTLVNQLKSEGILK